MDRMYLQKTKGFYRVWACADDRHYRKIGSPTTLAGAYREAGERAADGTFSPEKWERRQTELSDVDKWIDHDTFVVAVVGDIRYISCLLGRGESLKVIGRNVVAGGFEANTWGCHTPPIAGFNVTEKVGGWKVSQCGEEWPRKFASEAEALQALGRYVLGGGDSELREQEFKKLILARRGKLWEVRAYANCRWHDIGELTTAKVKGLIDSGVVYN